MKFSKRSVLIMVAALIVMTGVAVAGTLEEVRSRGYLLAGVNGGVAGFSMPDEKGEWNGLDVETAAAMALAVSTSNPFHSPFSSGILKPATPPFTPANR